MDKLVQYDLKNLIKDVDGAFDARCRMGYKEKTDADRYKMQAIVLGNVLADVCAKINLNLRGEYMNIRDEMFIVMDDYVSKMKTKEIKE